MLRTLFVSQSLSYPRHCSRSSYSFFHFYVHVPGFFFMPPSQFLFLSLSATDFIFLLLPVPVFLRLFLLFSPILFLRLFLYWFYLFVPVLVPFFVFLFPAPMFLPMFYLFAPVCVLFFYHCSCSLSCPCLFLLILDVKMNLTIKHWPVHPCYCCCLCFNFYAHVCFGTFSPSCQSSCSASFYYPNSSPSSLLSPCFSFLFKHLFCSCS